MMRALLWCAAAGLFAPSIAPVCAGDDEVSRLIAELGSADAGRSAGARERLAKIGRPALPSLVRGLGEDLRTRTNAAETIALFGSDAAPAVPFLMLALTSRGRATSDAARKALVAIGEPARARIARGLTDEGWQIVCADAIGHFGAAARSSIPDLVTLLESNRRCRREAATSLGRIGSEALPALRKALGHAEPDVRGFAAWAMAMEGPAGSVEALKILMEMLQRNDSLWHGRAYDALGRIGPPAAAAAEAIRQRMQKSSPTLRARAEAAIAAIERK